MISILTILVISLAIIITAQNATKDSEKKAYTSMAKPSPANSPTPTPTPTSTPSEDNQPTSIPPTSTPTTKPDQPTQTISDFQYPGSTVTNNINNTTTYESTDDPKKITEWYKEKIKSMDMNVTSFVQTSTNRNILNKLAGANSDTEAKVEITKQNNSQIVKMSASLSIDN